MTGNSSTNSGIDPKNGTGNWQDFAVPFDQIEAAAARWRRQVEHVEKPWLCWAVSPRWCLLQQRLVQYAGWTPVVGYDPRIDPPPVVEGSVLMHFNTDFGFPTMWPHFPLEFAFLWTKRLAFWHADLLCRLPVMQHLSTLFDSLEDGEMAAVLDRGGRRNYLNFKTHRYWELCGCTTRAASENQFYNGTGWWRNFALHPKCTVTAERNRRLRYSYDSGVGIRYWKVRYNGAVRSIDIGLVKEGHCSEINNPKYTNAPGHTTALRSLATEIDLNYDIEAVAARLGIADLLD